RHVVDSVINNTGVIEANTVGTKNGMIVLGAATDDKQGASEQKVVVSGVLSARGRKSGEKGGTIQITGESIALKGAKIRASGDAGGGTVLIGGGNGGGGGEFPSSRGAAGEGGARAGRTARPPPSADKSPHPGPARAG